METSQILDLISRGRTDLIVELIRSDSWPQILDAGKFKPLQWLVYYNDITALRLVMMEGGSLESIDVDTELGNAAFFGHWKVCDFLIANGADVNYRNSQTHETALHNAVSKAGRPYYYYVVKLLVERGADVNARTLPGIETGAFMRDVRTKGETPLHRAAAYADARTIEFLVQHGAEIEARDSYGNSPLSWASEHMRPGSILSLLTFDDHYIGTSHVERNTSDHGQTWGSGMDWNVIGDFLPLS